MYNTEFAGNETSILQENNLFSISNGFIVANASVGLYGVNESHLGASYHTDSIEVEPEYILTNAHDTQLLIHDCHTYDTLYLPAFVTCSQSTLHQDNDNVVRDIHVHQFIIQDVFAWSIAYVWRDDGALCCIFISYGVFTVIVHSGFVKQQSFRLNIALHHVLSISMQFHHSICQDRKSAVHHDLNATLSSTLLTGFHHEVDGFQHISSIQFHGDTSLGITDINEFQHAFILSTRCHDQSNQLTETSLSIFNDAFAFKS